MRQYSKKITLDGVPKIVDTCGTGGDNLSTFNISTASAFVLPHMGLRLQNMVVKWSLVLVGVLIF